MMMIEGDGGWSAGCGFRLQVVHRRQRGNVGVQVGFFAATGGMLQLVRLLGGTRG